MQPTIYQDTLPATEKPKAAWPLLHGLLYLVFAIGLFVAVPVLRAWPWFWIAPLAAYHFLVFTVPWLRRSFRPVRLGTITRWGVAATAVISIVAAAALVIFHITMKPDVRILGATLPVKAMGGIIAGGVIFSLLNAILEEWVFRGIFFNSVEPHLGRWWAVLIPSLIFGLAHQQGYPPGALGMLLSGIYAVALGWLRVSSGGLALPIASHIVADATIYLVLAREGVL